MNQELQKQLAELLSKLMNVASDAAKFAGDQIPPLVQEKVTFGRAWETTLLVLLIVLTFALFRFCRWCWKSVEDEVGQGLGIAVGSFATAAAALSVIVQVQPLLMVWFAPRLYIVEWLKGMVSK